jgi:glutamate decarboxylase
VDAAWGGALLFSRVHKRRLRGLERAHSVTIDAHKQMYLPIGTSLLLLRDPQLARTIRKSSDYILQDGSCDLGRHSVEGSRPGSSLFVHAALHIIGRQGYETLVNDSLGRAAFMARQILAREDFELLAEPETNIVLYRYVPPDLRIHRSNGGFTAAPQGPLNIFNTALQQEQWRASRSAVSRTSLQHPQYADPIVAFRAVVANPLATEADVCALLDDQAYIARKLRPMPA